MNYNKQPEQKGLYSMLQDVASKQMREGGRVYKFGGKTYPHGGVHNPTASVPDIKIMVKDSYSTTDQPRPGTDYIFMQDGQPTDFSVSDVMNLLKSEGISGDNLNMAMNDIMAPTRGPRSK